jgi:hypothetical protein
MAVALAALFVALGGTAVAAGVPSLAKRALIADNAKKLGGQTPAALLATAKQAAEASASAAAQQPGPASTAAGLVVIKTASWSLSPRSGNNFTVMCDSGQKVVAGGWSDPGDWSSSWQSLPTADGNGWTTNIYTPSVAPGTQSGSVYAICLK